MELLLSPATDGGHLANQATIGQVQQFPPQGTVAPVAPVASAESLQTPGAAPRLQSKRRRPSKSEQEVWTKSSTETLFTVSASPVSFILPKDAIYTSSNPIFFSNAWSRP
ncbi:hypothetical protein GQ600_12484 [Phytophthora cactorum]|nr:hypothetical protein GQ600_12484 [Phytophthora cactorum]